jgi:hypothetical protein
MAADLQNALSTLLTELVDGPPGEATWILNTADRGLLKSLDRLSAEEASTPTPLGGPPIAAHVDHLRYALELFNRWNRGERNPFATADWSASWRLDHVNDTEWAALRDQIRAEATEWMEAVARPRELNSVELTGTLASVAHIAYHLGAIRQIARPLVGPPARSQAS